MFVKLCVIYYIFCTKIWHFLTQIFFPQNFCCFTHSKFWILENRIWKKWCKKGTPENSSWTKISISAQKAFWVKSLKFNLKKVRKNTSKNFKLNLFFRLKKRQRRFITVFRPVKHEFCGHLDFFVKKIFFFVHITHFVIFFTKSGKLYFSRHLLDFPAHDGTIGNIPDAKKIKNIF